MSQNPETISPRIAHTKDISKYAIYKLPKTNRATMKEVIIILMLKSVLSTAFIALRLFYFVAKIPYKNAWSKTYSGHGRNRQV